MTSEVMGAIQGDGMGRTWFRPRPTFRTFLSDSNHNYPALTTLVSAIKAASVAFNAVMGNRTLHPEGSERISKASRELSAARKEMLDAHDRLNTLLARGIVPDDLKHRDD